MVEQDDEAKGVSISEGWKAATVELLQKSPKISGENVSDNDEHFPFVKRLLAIRKQPIERCSSLWQILTPASCILINVIVTRMHIQLV